LALFAKASFGASERLWQGQTGSDRLFLGCGAAVHVQMSALSRPQQVQVCGRPLWVRLCQEFLMGSGSVSRKMRRKVSRNKKIERIKRRIAAGKAARQTKGR